MIVRKSDEKRLVFAFLSLLPKQFQGVKSVSSPDEAPRSSSKKPAARRIFNSFLISVFHLVIKHCVSCFIYYI